MNYIKIEKPSTTYTKIAKVITRAGRYGIGVFGLARFGISDIYSKIVRPSTNYTKQNRP